MRFRLQLTDNDFCSFLWKKLNLITKYKGFNFEFWLFRQDNSVLVSAVTVFLDIACDQEAPSVDRYFEDQSVLAKPDERESVAF